MSQYGEWLEPETVQKIYSEARDICPGYPLYRHTACALASVLGRPNHTATVYREDICPPSQCSSEQREICDATRRVPGESETSKAIAALGRSIEFERHDDRVVIRGPVTQEEFPFLLHLLNCPIEVESVTMLNLYHGSIYKGQKTIQ
jgi:hypothetical protein